MRWGWWVRASLACAVVAAVFAPTAIAAPPNDNFSDATPINSLPYSTTVDGSSATQESWEPECGGDTRDQTVWFSFTSATRRQVEFDPRGSGSPIAGAYTGSQGNLTQVYCGGVRAKFIAMPGVKYWIQISGDGGSWTVDGRIIPWETAVTLRAAPTTGLHSDVRGTDYGKTVNLRAHLTSEGDDAAGKTVSIYGRPHLGTRTLIASGPTDAGGNFEQEIVAKKLTVYDAVYDGDAFHAAAAAETVQLRVRAKLSSKLSGFFRIKSGWRLYKQGHDPRLTIRVTPNHAGKKVVLRVRFLYPGGWNEDGQGFRLGAKGTVRIRFVNFTVGRYQVRAYWSGDKDHPGERYSAWESFRVVPN